MNNTEIYNLINSPTYDFLRTNARLADNLAIVTLGGSYAYGTNIETSDVDIRGCTLDSKRDILLENLSEQIEDSTTDTTIYFFSKLIKLLSSCNPNTIEMLGCKPEHYFSLSEVGKELLKNRKMFLSQKCISTFGGYANQQLRRLSNKGARALSPEEHEQFVLNSLISAKDSIKERYPFFDDKAIQLNINTNNNICIDISLNNYPLREYNGIMSELQEIVKTYDELGKRNAYAIESGRIAKHMMHLVRLYYMAFDILEKEEIITYREKEHDLLMKIRNGGFLDEDNQTTPEFQDLLETLYKRFEYDKNNTSLPKFPNMKLINDFVYDINEEIVK